jgi:aspartyl/glutamyl-tRNA(Asn/Gln) amidotransferase C subunit
MPVSRDDVLHIAGLARIGVPAERLDSLARELNGILAHMDALQRVQTGNAAAAADAARDGMPLGADEPPGVPLEHPREAFAPQMTRGGQRVPTMLDGFFRVPRLDTHDDAGEDG